MAEDIQVAMATDRNYLDYALVTAASLLAQHPGGGITLHLLHEELDESDFVRFEALRRIDGFRLVPRKIERGFFQGWPELRWSTSAYYRLILPSLLPDLEKILYLDCDLLVLDDIAELWNTELGGRSCAAAAVRVAPEHQKKIGLPAEAVYFNSGVMLFNLRKMAHENHEKRFIRLFDELGGRIKYPDQDILNLAYWNDYVKLSQRWNLVTSVYRNPPTPALYSEAEVVEALRRPGIAHFTGTHKPWRLGKTTHHPYARYFRAYAELAGLPLPFRLKLALKSLLTGSLKPPKKAVPWDGSILNTGIAIRRTT